MPSHPRVLFFGMPCAFSVGPLAALIAHDVEVAAVVIPGPKASWSGSPAGMRPLPPPPIPVLQPGQDRNMVHVAWRNRVPVLQAGRLSQRPALRALASYRPDFIAVACFPLRLPAELLALPTLGCLNVHPSLLPANRGPAPLFWTFRNGGDETGVTIHLMDERLDSGDIVFQQSVSVPEGILGRELERRCSSLGGELLIEAIRAIASGTAVRTPQREDLSSYFPFPREEDCLIAADRPARWAFSFIRGAGDLGYPLAVGVEGERLPVDSAISYDTERMLGQPSVREDEELWLQCCPGVLHVSLVGP